MGKSKIRHARKAFMLDPKSEKDLLRIQAGIRATNASEAIRYAIRRTSELINASKKGSKVVLEKDGSVVALDFPS